MRFLGNRRSLHNWIKIPLIGIGSLVLLLIIVWLILAAYVHSNKQRFLKNITTQLNEHISGKVEINNMSLALLKGFPGISVALEHVTLRDSLWHTHHHDLLNARYIYVSLNVFSLLKKSPKIKEVTLKDADIYIFIDSSGYTNAHVFQKKDKQEEQKGKQPQINHLRFDRVTLALDNRTKRKMFRLEFNDFIASAVHNDTGWVASTKENLIFRDMTFNEEKGSFLKNKQMRAQLAFHFNSASKTIYIPQQTIRLDEDKILFGGMFQFSTAPPQFSLQFKTKQIAYKNAVALVSPNIQKKLNLMDLKEPLDLDAYIDGRIKFRDTPVVKVIWIVKNNVFTTPGGDITDCSFSGYFLNSAQPNAGKNDKNSIISVPDFIGNYVGVPFRADSVIIQNIAKPILTGRLYSSFNVSKLNETVGSEAIQFNSGKADVDLGFKVALSKNDLLPPYIKGHVTIQDLGFTYLPRNISFDKSKVTLLFTGSDLHVRNTKLQSKSSVLYVSGTVLNFLNLYYTAPEKMVLDWHIESPLINLNEFQSLLAPRKTKRIARSSGNNRASKVSQQIDEALDKSNVHMKLSLDKVVYKKFTATDIQAGMDMVQTGISINEATVKTSGGTLTLNADIDQRGNINDVALKSTIAHVNVQKFFEQFNNFGQTAITSANIKGILSGEVEAKTKISDGGEIVGGSMFGSVRFLLENGELNNFEPFEKIGNFLFRNRNMAHVTFRDIKNRLDLNGDKIHINPMRIESSAFTMAIEGVYGLKNGTNISIDLPLRNPQKDADILNDSLRVLRSMKGIVLRLQAIDGEDGKVKIKLRSNARKRAEESLLKKEEEE